jgi:Ca-activated chloride channel family protein
LLLIGAVVALAALVGGAIWVARVESQAAAATASGALAVPAFSGPVSACLVIDRSGSMAGAPLADAKEAAKDFLKCLKSDDEAAVVDFGSDVHVACPRQQIGNDSPLLRAIDNILCNGSTALWDAGIEGVDILSSAGEGRARVLVLLTDGMNNASRNSVETLIDKAKNAKIVVHTVTLGVVADRATLQRIADETGGVYNHAQSSRQLRGIYQNLGKRIHKATP